MKRRTVAALAALLTVPLVGGVAAMAAVPGGVPGPNLAAVGPVDASNGFPVWYQDKNGLRLSLCVAAADPSCTARGPLPDETAPVSFPDNFPDEAFYSLASANLDTGGGGKALADIALEGAFRSGPVIAGDQITFARVRFKITSAVDGVDYKITSPVGTKTLQTSKAGLVFDTEDIGIGSPGDFTGPLGGRIGPFLTWDTFGTKSDPALLGDTYIGDSATAHKITGSPGGTNFFRIEGPGINPTPATDACPTVGGAFADCLETDLFTVQGKLATTTGVTAEQATYSRSGSDGGVIDVFASAGADASQSIQVSDGAPAGAAAFDPTALVGDAGHYFARVQYRGTTPPAQVRLTNVGDVPASSATVAVVDRVSGTATYDTDARRLTVIAGSSDTATAPALTATGYGPLGGGTLTLNGVNAPPVAVAVTSAAGGTATLPVAVTGGSREPIPVTAQAGPDQVVQPGQLVTLDGSASGGSVATYAWTSADNSIVLTNPDRAQATFTAPTTAGDYRFDLTVGGPGGPSTASVLVTVLAAQPVVANAGPAQTVQRGKVVTLDGTGSTGAATYSWSQVKITPGDPVVVLGGAKTARPTFTFPFYKSPATNGPLRFQLQVTDAAGNGPAPVTVDITPTADTVVVTTARYASGRWRVDGTSSILAGQIVTAHLGSLGGTLIGRAVVDATGAFSVRTGTGPAVSGTQVVVVESQLGGVSAAAPVRIG